MLTKYAIRPLAVLGSVLLLALAACAADESATTTPQTEPPVTAETSTPAQQQAGEQAQDMQALREKLESMKQSTAEMIKTEEEKAEFNEEADALEKELGF